MANRTSESAVKTLLGKNYDSNENPSVVPFIDTAHVLVDWLAAADVDSELTESTLELIERWLSAHFYLVQDPMWKQKQTKSSSGTTEGSTGSGLTASRYGQTALSLDTTGRLAERSEGRKPITLRATWLGTE